MLGMWLRSIAGVIMLSSMVQSASAKEWVSCESRTGDDPITYMFTSNDGHWDRLTKKGRRLLKKAPMNKVLKVRLSSNKTVFCRVIMRSEDTRLPAENKTSGEKATTKKRTFKPSRGGLATIPPEKITVSERMQLYAPYVEDAAQTFQLPENFIKAVIKIESRFNYQAKSHRGAIGLMQLMPKTASALGVADPYDPRQNIMGGAKFLRRLANRYGGDMVQVLSAYNAGPGAVAKHGGDIPYPGAERYVRAVLREYYAFEDGQEKEAGKRP